MHAGSFTQAGHGAFQAKGIPTEDDIERGFDDYLEQRISSIDDEEVRHHLEVAYPDEDWDSSDAPWSLAEGIQRELADEYRQDPMQRDMYREDLESMQAQVLENLPDSRRGAFAQGWKPKYPTRGKQEEFEGLPQKYIGAFEG